MNWKKLSLYVGLVLVGIVLGFGFFRIQTNASTANKQIRVTKSSKNVTFPAKRYSKPIHTNKNAKRVFLNASMNKNGNTSALAKKLFGNLSYKQVNLSDYRIPQIGQGEGDFNKVWNQLKAADVIVIGTPVYWSNMSGYLTTFIDHMEINNDLKGKDLYVLVQGADSNQAYAINSTYGSLNRIAIRFQMQFVGIGQTSKQVNALHQKMIGK